MKYKINLIPKKEISLMEKLVYFSLHYLRYIIVITQLVVIGVFFFRFQVDQSIIDLKEAVDQKKQIVDIVLPLLNEASRIDRKSIEIKSIMTKQSGFETMMQYFLSIFPETVTLSSLEIKGANTMKVTGVAADPTHLQAFFQVLKKDDKFSLVAFDTIKKGDVGYEFILSLDKWKK